jgi:hypothetical protein
VSREVEQESISATLTSVLHESAADTFEDVHQRREQLSEVLARSLGEDELRQLARLGPMRTRSGDAPPTGPAHPFDRQLVAKDVSIKQWIEEEREAELEARLPHRRLLPYRSALYPPFDLGSPNTDEVDGITEHGGHPPAQFYAVGDPTKGELTLRIAIDDDSSNARAMAYLDATIRPRYSRGLLTATPLIYFQAWHYLAAAGGGGCHSDGYVGMILSSTKADGSDYMEEARHEVQVWDKGIGGPLSYDGTEDLTESPDNQGIADAALTLQAVVEPGRVYKARAYIRSDADADGRHLGYASQAFVAFYGTLMSLQTEDEWV